MSVAFALRTGFFLFRSYHNIFRGYEYKGLPYPTQLFAHKEELDEYYKQHAQYFSGVTGQEKFEDYLTGKMAELIDVNAFNNDTKSRYLHSSKSSIFISILMLVLSVIPFLSNTINNHTNSTKDLIKLEGLSGREGRSFEERWVKIENSISMSNNQPATPPPPPPPPPDRTIKEGKNPLPPPPPPPHKQKGK